MEQRISGSAVKSTAFKPLPVKSKTYHSFYELNKAIMQHHLMEQLWAYVIVNNPELMIKLKADNSVTTYLETKVAAVMPLVEKLVGDEKPNHVITELCLNELTADLGASRFRYIRYILEEEFPNVYRQLKTDGTLSFETIHIVSALKKALDELNFNAENAYEDDVYDVVVNCVWQYLNQEAMQEAKPV
jgi:hypothetical protein